MEERISDLEGRIAAIKDVADKFDGLSDYISSQRSKLCHDFQTVIDTSRARGDGMLLNDLYKKECCITKSIDVFCRENI